MNETVADQSAAPRLRPGPLAGVVILDLSRILAGPYCSLLLNELGARVIKVEPPGGDDARAYGPFKDGESLYFAAINRGKESIQLDLKQAGDKAILERLLEGADVLLENFRPGTMEKLGLGWEDLRKKYPRLIYAAASGFGWGWGASCRSPGIPGRSRPGSGFRSAIWGQGSIRRWGLPRRFIIASGRARR
jgi:CoA:oxalate CoA-transferase